MYNQTYDDYMRSVLGYPNVDGYRMNNMNSMGINNMGLNTMNMNNMNTMGMTNSQDMSCEDIEQLYPEVYRVVYPMVCSSCDRMQFPNAPVTNEMITRMTDDIYDRVEADGRINVEVTVEVREIENKHSSSETRQRRPRNRFLRDLIRILLLRELFRRRRFPGRFPIRPF
jgi:hypothetical protein